MSDEVEGQTNHDSEFYSEIRNINGTNDITTIQAKLSPPNKYNNEATTQKLQLKAEKIVDNYPVVAEPHEATNGIGDNIFSDVDTNFIDVGQQVPRNSSSRFQFGRSIKLMKDFVFFFSKSINKQCKFFHRQIR